MYGAILGDIIGSPYEFDRGNKTKSFPLFMEESDYTDDSVMTIAVADALMLMKDLEADAYGEWHGGLKDRKSPDDTIQMPFVAYSERIHRLLEEVYAFHDEHPDFRLNEYAKVLEENGLQWKSESLKNTAPRLFEDIKDFMKISMEGRNFALMHYPMLSWPKKSSGGYQLHGHIHARMEYNEKIEQKASDDMMLA